MGYTIKTDKTVVSTLLSNKSISVNNLTISLTNGHSLEIETHGPWQGSIEEIIELLGELTTEDGQD
jgi:hypothetical protein